MKAAKLSINNLFMNDRFVLVFSLVAAAAIWIAVAINVSPETERVIQNVKVTIESSNSVPSQLGLKSFGEEDNFVDVTIVGKKYLISNATLKADDITVTAITDNVTSSGLQKLELKASSGEDYKVVGLSESSIIVYFDFEKTQEFSIAPEIVSSGDFELTEKGFKLGDPLLSVSTISVTGPANEIANIKSVVAHASVTSTVKTNTTLTSELRILDANGQDSLRYLTTDLSGEITMVVPVYGVKNLSASVAFKNSTSYYLSRPLSYSITPASGEFSVNVEDYETIKTAVIGTIDFKNISVRNNIFTFPADKLTDILYNGTEKEFKVTIDMSGMEQRTFSVPQSNIKIINNANTPKASVINGLNSVVTIVGPSETLELLTAADIFAEIDLQSEALGTGTTTLDARVYTSNTTCWAYGSYSCDIKVE